MALLLIVLFFVFIIIIGNISQKDVEENNSSSRSNSRNSSPTVFEFRARKAKLDSLDVLHLEVKGPVNVAINNFPLPFIVEAYDISSGKEKPILCSYARYQCSDTHVLQIKDTHRIPYKNSLISEWSPIAIIPIDSLIFPYKGIREIQFTLNWFSKPIIKRQYNIKIRSLEVGYLEAEDNRRKYDKLAVQLAFAVSGSDGELHKDEASIIKSWIKKRIELTDDESFKNEMNKIIKDEVDTFESDPAAYSPDVAEIAANLNEVSSTAEKYDLMELLMKIVSSDGIANASELKIINNLTGYLGLDESKFRSMRDIHIPASKMNHLDEENIDEILGIKESMSESEIKKHLREEYANWNSLASHSDKEKRDQAKHMLKLIGKRRSQLMK